MSLKSSILRKLRFYMILFGIFMGFVFPVYANFFVNFKEGMFVFFVVGCIAAGITVGVVSFTFVKVILLKPLLKVSNVANDIQSKNITGFIDIKSKDSVGDIVNGLNAAVKSLNEFICEIVKITGLIEEIINNTDSKNSSYSAVGRIEKSITVVSEISECMSTLSGKIMMAVNKGKESASLSSDKLRDTNSNVNELSELIDSLGQNSEKIHDILVLINGIAAQTNMLSLNASIEAARAGEYGKSFAVVANEVRDLARNVSESAGKITSTISYIQNDIKKALAFVETINEDVVENNKNSEQIHFQLDEIVKITDYNLQANQDLLKSVNKLNSSFSHIKMAFGQLSKNVNRLHKVADSYEQ